MSSIIIISPLNDSMPLVLAINRLGNTKDTHYNPEVVKNYGQNIICQQFISCDAQNEIQLNFGINKYLLFATTTTNNYLQKTSNDESNIIKDLLKLSSINDMYDFISNIDPTIIKNINVIFGSANKVYVATSYFLDAVIIDEVPKGINLISDCNNKKNMIRSIFAHSAINIKLDWKQFYLNIKHTLKNTKHGLLYKPHKTCKAHTKSSTIVAFTNNGIKKYSHFNRNGEDLKYINYTPLFNDLSL